MTDHTHTAVVIPTWSIRVIGTPAPQGSKNAFVVNGRAVVVDKNPKTLKPWRDAVAQACSEAITSGVGWTITGPCRVTIDFVMAPIKSDPDRCAHVVAPDGDKLTRGTLDALKNGRAYTDDALACQLVIRKRYAWDDEAEGAYIELADLTEENNAAVARRRERRKAAAKR